MKTVKPGYLVIVFGILMLIPSSSLYAQDKNLTKEEKKQLRIREREAAFKTLDSLISTRRFVLEAQFLQARSGERENVNSTINYIKVDLGKSTLQVGSNMGMGGNGLGGVTAEGEITNWNQEKNVKNHSVVVRFSISSAIGHFDILLNASSGNYTSALVTGTRSGQLTWTGNLVPLQKSRVYRGQTSY
jgi:hypothetical protein